MRLPFVAPPLWWVGARCRSQRIPLGLFFARETATEAKRVCVDCPVRLRCLTEHLDEPFGVWGGHSRDERSRISARISQGTTLAEASRSIDKRRRTG